MSHKSEALLQIALSNGWKAETLTDVHKFNETNNLKDVIWHLYAQRERETIHVLWEGNRLAGGLYKYGDHTVKLWWKNEVVKFLTGKPDITKFYRHSNEVASADDEYRSVPWENDTPAVDIMLAVVRKEVKWIRKIDGQIRSAFVDVNLQEPGSAKHFRVYESKHGRVLEWADALGFHSVALDQIIDVA